MTVTFFGHRNTPAEIYGELLETVIDLVENHGANIFFVGDSRGFDCMVRRILKMLSREYPDIHYSVVLAYMPSEEQDDYEDYSDTVFPEILDGVHKKYAIEKRNRWMVDISDTVVCYVKNSYGGAYKFSSLAKRKGKNIINLYKA